MALLTQFLEIREPTCWFKRGKGLVRQRGGRAISTFPVLALLILGLTVSELSAILSAAHPPSPTTQTCTGLYDGFSSPLLEPGWAWINEGRWSLTERPGYLRVYTDYTEDDPTYLVREAPDGIGKIWTHLEVQSAENFQPAGILIYQDDDNWLRLTRQTAPDQTVFFVLASRIGGEWQVQPVPTDVTATRLALRIRRQGGRWRAEYALPSDNESTDWVSVGSFEVDFQTSRVGLVTTKGETGESPVDFDDFCLVPLTTLTPTPTPTTTPGDLTLTGQVYDAADGPAHGVSGATVSVLTCEPRRFQTLSGPDGQYSLLVPGQYLSSCSQVTLEVWAADYDTFSQPVAVGELYAQPERNFALTPAGPTVYLPMLLRAYAAPTPTATPTVPSPPIPPPPVFTPTATLVPGEIGG